MENCKVRAARRGGDDDDVEDRKKGPVRPDLDAEVAANLSRLQLDPISRVIIRGHSCSVLPPLAQVGMLHKGRRNFTSGILPPFFVSEKITPQRRNEVVMNEQ